jgi:hypothetical protein
MNFLNILGYKPNELDESEFEVELRACKYCAAYHNEDSEFCCEECEQGYKWEYEQDFYTSQNREQE